MSQSSEGPDQQLAAFISITLCLELLLASASAAASEDGLAFARRRRPLQVKEQRRVLRGNEHGRGTQSREADTYWASLARKTAYSFPSLPSVHRKTTTTTYFEEKKPQLGPTYSI